MRQTGRLPLSCIDAGSFCNTASGRRQSNGEIENCSICYFVVQQAVKGAVRSKCSGRRNTSVIENDAHRSRGLRSQWLLCLMFPCRSRILPLFQESCSDVLLSTTMLTRYCMKCFSLLLLPRGLVVGRSEKEVEVEIFSVLYHCSRVNWHW